MKNVAHWAQAIRKSRQREHPLFQMYDYGSVCTSPRGLPRTCNMRCAHSGVSLGGICCRAALPAAERRTHDCPAQPFFCLVRHPTFSVYGQLEPPSYDLGAITEQEYQEQKDRIL